MIVKDAQSPSIVSNRITHVAHVLSGFRCWTQSILEGMGRFTSNLHQRAAVRTFIWKKKLIVLHASSVTYRAVTIRFFIEKRNIKLGIWLALDLEGITHVDVNKWGLFSCPRKKKRNEELKVDLSTLPSDYKCNASITRPACLKYESRDRMFQCTRCISPRRIMDAF